MLVYYHLVYGEALYTYAMRGFDFGRLIYAWHINIQQFNQYMTCTLDTHIQYNIHSGFTNTIVYMRIWQNASEPQDAPCGQCLYYVAIKPIHFIHQTNYQMYPQMVHSAYKAKFVHMQHYAQYMWHILLVYVW